MRKRLLEYKKSAEVFPKTSADFLTNIQITAKFLLQKSLTVPFVKNIN